MLYIKNCIIRDICRRGKIVKKSKGMINLGFKLAIIFWRKEKGLGKNSYRVNFNIISVVLFFKLGGGYFGVLVLLFFILDIVSCSLCVKFG